MAILVTVTDALLGFPDRLLHGPSRQPADARLLVVAVLMPLWASYLVKIYAWRTIFQGNGVLAWVLVPFGIAGPGNDEIVERLARVQLPLAAVHDPADLRRPRAHPELAARGVGRPRRAGRNDVPAGRAAARLARARGRIDLHVLTDPRRLHRAGLVSDAKFIGNVIYDNPRLGNFPVAAAYSMIPIVIMIVYLLVARRLGAFESL